MSSLEIERLLTHTKWVERLARSLVRDPALAEDVAQEAWLNAVRRPPQGRVDVRAWLTRVVQNAAHSLRRSQGAQRARERAAARDEALPSAHELVAEVEMQRVLSAHLLALEEPYRTTLILRYQGQLGPRAIAAQLGVPVSTVKTRLQRGLDKLRARLDDTFGSRASWCAAVVVLERPLRSVGLLSTQLLTWISAMNLKLGLALAAVAVALGVYLLQGPEAPVTEAESLSPAAEGADFEPPASPPAIEVLTAAERTTERAPIPTEDPAVASATAAEVVRGRLVDLEGRPLPGRRMRWFGPHAVRWSGPGRTLLRREGETQEIAPERLESILADETSFDGRAHLEEWWWTLRDAPPAELLTETDAQGRFSYAVPTKHAGGSLELDEQGWAFLGGGWGAAEDGTRELVLVGATTIDFGGIVVDPEDRPLAVVSIRPCGSFQAASGFPLVLDTRTSPGQTQTFLRDDPVIVLTGADGRFHYRGAPRIPGSKLLLLRHGYENLEAPLPPAPDFDLRFVMRPEDDWGRIAGRVLDPQGRPVEGAEVSWSGQNGFTDRNGAFAIALREWIDEESALLAVKKGYLAARDTTFGGRVAESREGHEKLVLVLGGAPLSIAGTVTDAAGNPQPGWAVALQDPTPKWELSLEEANAGVRQPVETDAAGRFALGGLFEREYRLRAWDPATHLVVISEPIPAGATDVRIVLPQDPFHSRVAGRVVDDRGLPIAGATITLARYGVMVNREGSYVRSEPTETDSDGRFSLERVPREHVFLQVNSERTERRRWAIEEITTPLDSILSVQRLFRFQVELGAADVADAFAILDESGERLPVTVFLPEFHQGASQYPSYVPRSPDGSFPISEISATGKTLVLLSDGRELRRSALHLEQDGLQVLQL